MRSKDRKIEIEFYYSQGYTENIDALLKWLCQRMENKEIPKAKICVRCGEFPEKETQTELFGISYEVHPECASSLQRDVKWHRADYKNYEKKGLAL